MGRRSNGNHSNLCSWTWTTDCPSICRPVVLVAEVARHHAGPGQLVVGGIVKADRIAFSPPLFGGLAHHRHHRARIETAAEKSPEGRLAHQPDADGVAREIEKLGRQIGHGGGAGAIVQLPVAPDAQPLPVQAEPVALGQLADPLKMLRGAGMYS